MQTFLRLLLVLSLLPVFAGCNSIGERKAVLAKLSPCQMTGRQWKYMTGTYTGAMRSSSRSFGTTGVTTSDMKLKIAGTPDAPEVFLKFETSCCSAWNASENYSESFTNIPSMEFAVKGRIQAGSHAPDQLLVHLDAEIFSPNRGAALILTLRKNGDIDAEYIGHFGRWGTGSLYRVPDFSKRH